MMCNIYVFDVYVLIYACICCVYIYSIYVCILFVYVYNCVYMFHSFNYCLCIFLLFSFIFFFLGVCGNIEIVHAFFVFS